VDLAAAEGRTNAVAADLLLRLGLYLYTLNN
jgi:hypothetical protein